MSLVVGHPVFERAWCLNLWFDSLEAQNLARKQDITLCFAYSQSFDGTYDILRRRGEEYGNLLIYEFDLPTFPDREDMSRFHTLATLRNCLLDMVKEVGPDYFLSWDNDILFMPNQLEKIVSIAEDKTAVGALVDMGGRDNEMFHPSVMNFGMAPTEVAFRRPWIEYPHDRTFKCDVIMAVKAMGKDVYENTRYRWDPIGEDIGWSKDCEQKGYNRYLNPLCQGIHLYDRASTINVLKREKKGYPEVFEALSQWYI